MRGSTSCVRCVVLESVGSFDLRLENSRCVQDYATPEGKVLSRDLTHVLNTAIQFLVECRPLSVSMGNAIKYLKLQAKPQPLSLYPYE